MLALTSPRLGSTQLERRVMKFRVSYFSPRWGESTSQGRRGAGFAASIRIIPTGTHPENVACSFLLASALVERLLWLSGSTESSPECYWASPE